VRCWPPASATFDPKAVTEFYGKDALRVTVPFHSGAALHPKIVKQVLETIEESRQSQSSDAL
jgi:hypothetical protein